MTINNIVKKFYVTNKELDILQEAQNKIFHMNSNVVYVKSVEIYSAPYHLHYWISCHKGQEDAVIINKRSSLERIENELQNSGMEPVGGSDDYLRAQDGPWYIHYCRAGYTFGHQL